ncbi:DUF2529 domain-containing protein [Priestia flexa]|uniref:DUF2529 domain-containing protein n=1 Tax=Priestia flexa TaxID=86664 RepID=UPI000E686DBE|nr:DUF2529 domain-containing protein [Priestia flexa]MBN8433553.1 DUF2529 domain-containing protein [Priestia flexa]MCA0966188.1 DUF2529 domain-containing protein [Priestia flexa]MCA1203863.1 DUF2529 domain-containing protein [Priestia flexa]RIV07523.1 DUF2529 family protein [Priestia flexa]UIR29908.1 DUF2529 domain-containing protein [Priestia flexa]
MLKIFTTQLSSYFKRIGEKEEFNLEDGARILAQAAIGEGNIYIYGVNEMQAVMYEATQSAEPLAHAKSLELNDISRLTSVDRVLIVTRFSTDEKAVQVAHTLLEQGIPFVSIGAIPKEVQGDSIHELADVHINTYLLQPLIPDDSGERFGFPALMTTLYAYYGLSFTLKEIMDENE